MFQQKVTHGRWTLPFAAVYGAGVWLLAGLVQRNLWAPFLLMALSVYLMVELNNRNTLLRTRSRMVSSSFVMLSLMSITQLSDWRIATVQLCMVAFLMLIFQMYQSPQNRPVVFYAFMFVGIASVAWVHILWMVPLLLILLARPLYGMSLKGFSAAILGLICPLLWCSLVYVFLKGDYEPLLEYVLPLADASVLLNYKVVTLEMILPFAIHVVLLVTGMVYFFRTSYKDKIRVRMLYWVFILLSLFLTLAISVAPAYHAQLMAMLTVTVSPLVARYFLSTRARIINYVFILLLLLVVACTVYGITISSQC